MNGRSLRGTLCLVAAIGSVARGEEPQTVEAVIARAEARRESASDYECVADTESRLGEKHEASRVRVWFKKPRLLRLRVVRGDEKGSEIVVDGDGHIRARKDGLLKAFVARVKPDDPRLRTARGTSVLEIEWGAFFRRFRERAARPGAETLLSLRTGAEAPHEVVLTYREEGKVVREVYRIDPQLWTLTDAEILEDGVRVSRATFSETRIGTGLKDDWFRF